MSDHIDTEQGAYVNVDQRIEGYGWIYGLNGAFTNYGTIDANVQGRQFRVSGVNDGTIRASNGGILVTETLSGRGSVEADGGIIRVSGPMSSFGPISLANGGRLETSSLFGPPQLSGSNLLIDRSSSINITTGRVTLYGNLSFDLTDESKWQWAPYSPLTLAGGAGATIGAWERWSALEVGGSDRGGGANNPAFDNNFELGELHIGVGAHVLLRDLLDNGNRGGPGGQLEALYVDKLVFDDSSSQLNLNGLHLYYKSLVGSTSQIVNTPVPEPAASALLLALASVRLARRRSRLTLPV
jgi:hypothetical protein